MENLDPQENKILTAEQLYYNTFVGLNIEDNECLIPETMIEFAKIHVEAALKSAAENAELDDIGSHNGEEWISHTIVDKDSILKSYPLDNIK